MPLLDEENRKNVAELFAKELSGKVNLFVFHDTDPAKCQLCRQTLELAKEIPSPQ